MEAPPRLPSHFGRGARGPSPELGARELGSSQATEAKVPAAADREPCATCSARDAACLPFGMVGELRRKLGLIITLVLLLGMGVEVLDIRVSAISTSCTHVFF